MSYKFERWKGVFIARLIEIACESNGNVPDCEAVTNESDKYRNNQDKMMAFFKEYVVRDRSGSAKPPKIGKTELTNQYHSWYKLHHGVSLPTGQELFDFMDTHCGAHVGGYWKGFFLKVTEANNTEEDD